MKKENNSPTSNAPSTADQMKTLEELHVEDILKANASIFAQIKKWQSISAAPSYRLAEILPKVNVDTLRDIYRAHRLKPGAGKLKKQQLVDRLLKELPDADELKGFVMMQPDMQWAFFRDALRAKELKDDQDMMDWSSLARRHGYVYLFYHQEEFTYAVPDEIKEAFKQFDDEDLHNEMELRSWLNYIACAAVNLYGALSLGDFAQLINDQSKVDETDKLTANTIEYCLFGYAIHNDDYRIWEGYLAAIDFADDNDDDTLDMDAVRGLLETREGKPRYTPDVKTFLRYADPDYYEETSQVKALKKALRTMGLSDDKTQELTDALNDKIAAEEDVPEVIHALDECGVILESGHAERILRLIMEMINATRIWRNFGHTPDETVKILGRSEPRAFHFGPGITKMFQRGDLNPDDHERAVQGRKLINEDFKNSFMSEIARVKSLTESDAVPEAINNVIPLRKPGRNDPCPCGSGLKYKRCCGKGGRE